MVVFTSVEIINMDKSKVQSSTGAHGDFTHSRKSYTNIKIYFLEEIFWIIVLS